MSKRISVLVFGEETEEVNCNQREVILGLAEMVQGMRKLETIRSQEARLTSLSQKLFLTRSFHSLKLSVLCCQGCGTK